jgi:hypothetical protein
MAHGMMEIALGFVSGCVIASGIWAILWALLRNERATSKRRDNAMEEIAEECAEIDKELSMFAMKALSLDMLKSAVMPRLEAMNKTLTINMRLFDVYYVKYIEGLVTRYHDSLFGETGRQDFSATIADADRFLATESAEAGSGATGGIPVNFDKKWQMDFSKENPRPFFGIKDTAAPHIQPEIEKAAPKDIPEVEKEIAEAFENRPVEAPVSETPKPETSEEKNLPAQEIVETIKPQTPSSEQTEDKNQSTESSASKDEEFISGEDLVDKIDTFFGINDNQDKPEIKKD